MIFKKSLFNLEDNSKYVFDYYYSNLLLRIFSICWIAYVIYVFEEISYRPNDLYEPVIFFQQLFMPFLPSPYLFYSIASIAVFLCFFTIFKNNISYRILLFLLLMWLNAVKWNYNFFSHVGHLFLLAHFFTIFLPPINFNKTIIKEELDVFSISIRWSLFGVLSTYTMAGIWKFGSLTYKLIFNQSEINWLSENAVELNAIVSSRLWDEKVSNSMLSLYEIPFIWQIGVLIIFTFQLIAIFGAFNKNTSYYVLLVLIIFHIYNIIFINTSFYVSSIILVILLFPYHSIRLKEYQAFLVKNNLF
jgi:hypothetical protein